MSIIQQHNASSLTDAWRRIDIDALDPDSSVNFDTSTLHPPLPETSEGEVRQLNAQVRQLLRGGDSEGALRGTLESPVYNGSDSAKVCGPSTQPTELDKDRALTELFDRRRISKQ
jgi:actin related protein 2/3 complex, subunit 5